VDRVVDGDTINVTVASGTERLRLLGIDTPETNHPTKPVECFGPEASERLRQLAPPGSELRLERDTELRDRYGRLLVYAFTTDGRFVNETLVREGFARTLPINPNRAYRNVLASAESAAQSASSGLWGACP
jgi:micrococcal nuclease